MKARWTALVAGVLCVFTSWASGAAVPIPVPGVYNNSTGSPLLFLFNSAQQSIDIEIYTMTAKSVRVALRAALARGVKVRILKDGTPVRETCDVFTSTALTVAAPAAELADCADQRALVREINAAPGSSYAPFNKDNLCGGPSDHCYQHGKMVIADGATVMISTGNFDNSNLCESPDLKDKCNRDYSMILNAKDQVATLRDVFEHDVVAARYDLAGLLKQHGNTSLTVSPLSLEPILNLINSARHSIQIQNQYLKDPKMNAALIAKARSGVKVQVTVSSSCAFGKPDATDTRNDTQLFTSFDQAGIQTRQFNASNKINGHPGYMHAKAIIVDGSLAWVGSVNGSHSALELNREFGVMFNEPQWVQGLAGVIAADFGDPDTESWQESLRCAKDRAD